MKTYLPTKRRIYLIDNTLRKLKQSEYYFQKLLNENEFEFIGIHYKELFGHGDERKMKDFLCQHQPQCALCMHDEL